jgi:hypothetical protein
VDSNSSTAILASGNARITAASVQVVGAVSTSGNAIVIKTGTPGGRNDPLVLTNVSTTGLTNYGAVNIGGSTTRTIDPGIYSSINASGNATLILKAGVYYIQGGGFTVSGNASVDGSAGVLIYNTVNGSTNGGITLSGNGTFNLKPYYTTGQYADILIFQSAANTRALSISANAMLGLSGTIYAPSALLTMSGNAQLGSSTHPVSLVVNSLNLSGNISLAETAAGSDGTGDLPGIANTLVAGNLNVYIDNSSGYFTADELALIQDAVNSLDALLVSYNVSITLVGDSASANFVLDAGTTSGSGGMGQGVLGCFNPDKSEITIIEGWNWFAGADPTQLGADQYDFETTVIHEFGHALGLGGASDTNSPMFEMLPTGTARRTMTTQDLNIPYPPDGADPLTASDFQSDHGGGAGGPFVAAAHLASPDVNLITVLTADRATGGDRNDAARTDVGGNFRMQFSEDVLVNGTGSPANVFAANRRTVVEQNIRSDAPVSHGFAALPLTPMQVPLSVTDQLFLGLAAGLPGSQATPVNGKPGAVNGSTNSLGDHAALAAVMAELGRADQPFSSRLGEQMSGGGLESDGLFDHLPQGTELSSGALLGFLAAGLWFNREEVESREERRVAKLRAR